MCILWVSFYESHFIFLIILGHLANDHVNYCHLLASFFLLSTLHIMFSLFRTTEYNKTELCSYVGTQLEKENNKNTEFQGKFKKGKSLKTDKINLLTLWKRTIAFCCYFQKQMKWNKK